MRLHPSADKPPDLVEGSGGVGVALAIEMIQLDSQAEQKTQFLDAKVSTGQMIFAIPGVGSFHKILEDIEGGFLDAVAEQKLLRPGKLLDGRDQPQQELEMRPCQRMFPT